LFEDVEEDLKDPILTCWVTIVLYRTKGEKPKGFWNQPTSDQVSCQVVSVWREYDVSNVSSSPQREADGNNEKWNDVTKRFEKQTQIQFNDKRL
jgi:hypothetical protein